MPIILLIIALAASFFYFGLTATLIQLACIGIGYLCIFSSTLFLTRKAQPYRALTVQSLIFFLLVSCEISLIYYAQYITSSTLDLVRTTKFIYDHPYAIKYGPYVILFIIQTLFIICFIRGSASKGLLISITSFICTGLIIYISWKFLLSDQTKIKWLLHIVQDLMGIYLQAENSEFYKALQTLHNQLIQYLPR